MRTLTLVAALIGVIIVAPARADMDDDCTQTKDWRLKIEGCTSVIATGGENDPGVSWAYSNRALAYQHLGENGTALRDIDRALELEPTAYQTLNIRGNLRARMGLNDGAERDWARSFELGGAEYVKTFQDWLQYHGHYSGAIDGVYGAAMRRAMFACSEDLDC